MLLIAVLSMIAVDQVPSERLQLTCRGGGSATKPANSSVYGADNSGNSGWATIRRNRSEGFEDQVDLWIEGQEGRIRLPRTMLPPIHGGEKGWIKLSDIDVGGDTITASASVNALNHPKVHIDRRSGVISIDGKSGHFVGDCAAMEADQPRKF